MTLMEVILWRLVRTLENHYHFLVFIKESCQAGWDNFNDYLFDRFSREGLGLKEARLRANQNNIFPLFGLSFSEVEREIRDHLSLVAKGNATEADGYPQVVMNTICLT